MDYRIKDVSRELGFSEKSILKRIKEEDFKKFVSVKEGIVYIDDEGIQYILDNSSKEEMFIENLTKIKEIEDLKEKEVFYLKKEVDFLKAEKESLREKNKSLEKAMREKDEEIAIYIKKLKEKEFLEERYNKLYSKVSEVLQKKEEKKERKKWIRF